MENLLVQSLHDYLSAETRGAFSNEGPREVRLFLASFPPTVLARTFEKLANDLIVKHPQVRLCFKVARPLWEAWHAAPGTLGPQLGKVFLDNDWVDTEDRLTFFRNEKARDNDAGLVTVLAGVDRVLDKGGLADFHQLSEETLWKRQLKGSYDIWIRRFLDAVGVEPSDAFVDEFDAMLKAIAQPRNLVHLADFLADAAKHPEGFAHGSEVVAYLFASLPAWGLFPVVTPPSGAKKRLALLRSSAEVARRTPFIDKAARSRALKRIQAIRENEDKQRIPSPLDGVTNVYEDFEAFARDLERWLEINDPEVRDRLMSVDYAPVHEVLNYKTPPGTKPPSKELRFHGPALSAFQSALWQVAELARNDLKERSSGGYLPAELTRIDITIKRFHHDLGSGEGESAFQLYRGLLGGIGAWLATDIAVFPSSHAEERSHVVPLVFHDAIGEDDMKAVKSRDPYVEFTISFHRENEENHFEQTCRWIVGSTHEERVLQALAKKALGALDGKLLPAYRVPTYTELFFSADAEEANRLLEISESTLEVVDLASGLKDALTKKPGFFSRLVALSQAYAATLKSIAHDGYFHALEKPVLKLLATTEDLYEQVLANPNEAKGDLGCALYKAHLLLPHNAAPFENHVPNAIAFGLTPAVLEQLQAREVFLSRAFPSLFARQLEGDASRAELDNLVGMVELQRPLLALVTNQHLRLSTKTRSLGLVHILGDRPQDVLSLASQAVMREEDSDDDDITDGELFRSTPESRIYASKLLDYYHTHPVAHDGMSVLAIDVENIQTLVAGVHEFLRRVLEEEDRVNGTLPPFQFSLHIYLMSASALSIQKWLEAWRRRWDPSRGRGEYPNCALSLAFRPAQSINDYLDLLDENDGEYDVAFLVRFLQAHDAGDHLEPAQPFVLGESESVMMKFPITEAPRPATRSQQDRYKRFTNLSNRRLRLPTLHAEVSARIKGLQSAHHMVFASVNHKPWLPLLDKLHVSGRCRWVVCMDPSIDRALLSERNGSDGGEMTGRELVGFSSGLGGLGELNVTVSTETTSVQGLTTRIGNRLGSIFKQWSPEDTKKAAQGLVSEAQRLSGFSLIRAIDDGESIREVAAHALVRRAFPKRSQLCDVLLSVDSYQHWLSSRSRTEAKYRPDLLRLSATVKDGTLNIDATVIECKLANESDGLRAHALEQVEAGLRILIKNFLPSGYGDESDAYVRRYWWAQLQRAIAAHSAIDASEAATVASAIERLGEGHFSITWHGVAMTFWTDTEASSGVNKAAVVRDWDWLGLDFDDQEFDIFEAAFNATEVAALAFGQPMELVLPCSGLRFAGKRFDGGADRTDSSGDEPTLPVPDDGGEPTSDPALSDEFNKVKSQPTEVVVPATTPLEVPEGQVVPAGVHVAEGEHPAGAPNVENVPSIAASPAVTPSPKAEPQTSRIPARILLGTSGTRSVYWEFGHPGLSNRHLLIFGRSGVGKTYAIQCLLAEFAANGQHAAVIDYTDGFLPMRLEQGLKDVAAPATHLVLQHPLPMNPLAPMESEIEGFGTFKERPHETAGRIMSVFDAVYGLGEQQQAKLVEAVKSALAKHEGATELKHLVEQLESIDGAAAGSALTLASKIKPFIEVNAFGGGDGGWKSIFEHASSHLSIIQLTRLAREYARVITEFALWDLYGYATNYATDKTPLPIVLDEVQTLNHRLDSPVAKILTEGRKFGLAGIFATQTMSNLKAEEQDRLFQAAHKLFFAPAESEVKEYAKLLAGPTGESVAEWVGRLSSLGKGECWSYGPTLEPNGQLKVKPQRIKITPFQERQLGGLS